MALEARRAEVLLTRLRRTAMRRGAISRAQGRLKADIASVIRTQAVPAALADRIAFQLVFKFNAAELEDSTTWRAIGQFLNQEVTQLKVGLGLGDRQIVEVLPKLSAHQVQEFLGEIGATDRRIARTILNAAIEAAQPLSAGRRYLAGYRSVVAQLSGVDPRVARTLANATFTARAPLTKALEHFKQFADLMKKFQGDVECARLLTKAAFRAPDPLKAAETFLREYDALAGSLLSNGVEAHTARMLASLRPFREALRMGGNVAPMSKSPSRR
jgi:hypothetical protein